MKALAHAYSLQLLRFSGNRSGALMVGVCAAVLTLTGCSRGVVGSDIAANGDWTRKVELHGPPPDKTGGMLPIPKLEESFVIPKAPWTVTKTTTDQGDVITCKRALSLGESLKRDVVCKAKTESGYVEAMDNECSVKQTAPGEYTYREVLHWSGPKPKQMIELDAVAHLKALLPASIATDASVRRVAESVTREFGLLLLGPPDPLITTIFTQVMMNPELAMHRISDRLVDGIDRALKTEYGNKLTDVQRRTVVEKLLKAAMDSTTQKANIDPTKAPNSKDAGVGVALMFSVKLPGKIISTNGNIDRSSNEVYWGLYPEAASFGQDIVLTATCRAK